MGKKCSIQAYHKLTGAQTSRVMTYNCLLNARCCVNILQLLSKIILLYRFCVMIFPEIRFLRLPAKPSKPNEATIPAGMRRNLLSRPSSGATCHLHCR